ncbi:MAG TPA: SDR family NAD(P)-dependent oxidoreductase [Candidatus Dormibacteraeota bacterium]|nr:SDR family NAD(P)-dependent oxidoreductase [Candidatus Dormibacteraeota bacterium]
MTGGAGGLGSATARDLGERGWRVFAADFAEEALARIGKERNVTPVHVDVTDAASVERAARSVAKRVDGLDGVVNFAGILTVGSLIELSDEALSRVLDVNVMGTFRVNKAFFPLLLARKGRIVNISSETGWQSGMPFNGPYGMSKHAIEAYSDSLRRELMFLGVPVIKIQPGPFKTEMVAGIERHFARAAKESRHFGKLLRVVKGMTLAEQRKAHDPSLIAEAVHTALTARHPAAAYSVKPDPGRVAMNLLPDWVVDGLLEWVLGRRGAGSGGLLQRRRTRAT